MNKMFRCGKNPTQKCRGLNEYCLRFEKNFSMIKTGNKGKSTSISVIQSKINQFSYRHTHVHNQRKNLLIDDTHENNR